MSIENSLERIAIALELLAGSNGGFSDTDDSRKPCEAKVEYSNEKVSSAKAPPPPNKAKKETPPPPSKSKKSAAAELIEDLDEPAMTVEELNKSLQAECTRLGGRVGVDKILKEYSVQSLTQLEPSIYSEVLAKVKALKS
jgi:hypothetical protein